MTNDQSSFRWLFARPSLPVTDLPGLTSPTKCLSTPPHPQCRSFCTGTDCRRSRHQPTGGQRGRKSQTQLLAEVRSLCCHVRAWPCFPWPCCPPHSSWLSSCHRFGRFSPQDRPRYWTTDARQPELREAHGRVHEGCEAGARQGAHACTRTHAPTLPTLRTSAHLRTPPRPRAYQLILLAFTAGPLHGTGGACPTSALTPHPLSLAPHPPRLA